MVPVHLRSQMGRKYGMQRFLKVSGWVRASVCAVHTVNVCECVDVGVWVSMCVRESESVCVSKRMHLCMCESSLCVTGVIRQLP